MLLSVACVDGSSCTHQQLSCDLPSPPVLARSRSGRHSSQSTLSASWSRLRPSPCDLVYQKRSLQCLSRSSEAPETQSEPAERDMSDLSSFNNIPLLSGQLCLCGVAILWGSYSPVVRYIYSCSGPPTPAALTAVRTVIQAFVLLVSDVIVRRQQYGSPAKAKTRRPIGGLASSSPTFSRRQEALPSSSNNILNTISSALHSTSSKLWIAGAELGFWNFCGSTFQALGLQYTTATRGAFLIQVVTLSSWQQHFSTQWCFSSLWFSKVLSKRANLPAATFTAHTITILLTASVAGEFLLVSIPKLMSPPSFQTYSAGNNPTRRLRQTLCTCPVSSI
ncbi:TPA: hypothetical protein ACH3X1_014204 [Trebouxia sp. C0004]